MAFGIFVWAQFHNGPPWQHPVASSRTIRIGNAAIQIDFGPGSFDLPTETILKWVGNSASSVATYYGRFPVARDRVLIEFAPGRGILRGTSWGGVGGFPAFHRMVLGDKTTQSDLDEDWEMTHEFIHSAFPSVDDEHHWIEEGLAVYVEPIARVQRGFLLPEKIWADMMSDMPKGDPGSSDRGLDQTHTWGRTYWGGAQFCLLADVMIREQTHNRKGLQDALRGIVDAGGTIDHDWPVEKAFETGDRATGTHVLSQLYGSMRDTPKPVDLQGLWQKLGVSDSGGRIRFDDHAPEADIRKAITRSPSIIPVSF
ncbi:hypothetical protein H7849_23710 [Alloacidobacterium dinghuense]|uniref:Peptidase M61 catalytic domain-containing protein n=1 Tax=Alloacidobacterium dinghuense TaxID=2763107 RepID=A0A7G8BRI8_9BACT|nr:hypothetical protein H7849_23710 [Alloacidobacterium dinghuense]